MKIEEYVLDENFDKNAQESLKRFEQASENLSKIEKEIFIGVRNIDVSYYEAYYNYIKADDDHMITFLNFIKICYKNAENGIKLCFYDKRKSEIFENLKNKSEDAFNKYVEYHERLSRVTNNLRVKLDQHSVGELHETDMINLQIFLMSIDSMHTQIANDAEKYRNEEIMPLLQSCEEELLFIEKNKPTEFLN